MCFLFARKKLLRHKSVGCTFLDIGSYSFNRKCHNYRLCMIHKMEFFVNSCMADFFVSTYYPQKKSILPKKCSEMVFKFNALVLNFLTFVKESLKFFPCSQHIF